MADGPTSNIPGLVVNSQSKEQQANALFDAASPAMTYGRNAATSSGLTWGFLGGNVVVAAGTRAAIANGTLTLTASSTCYIVAAKATGVVSFATTTTNWNNADDYWRLYSVVVGAATVTSWVDHRCPGQYQGAGAGAGSGGGGAVDSVAAGTGIDVDATDPANPEVSLSEAAQLSLAAADAALPAAAAKDLAFIDLPGSPSGYVLDDSGNWVPPSGGGGGDMTNPMTTAEDLIVGGVSGAPARLGVGSDGQVLQVAGGAVAWADPTGFANPMTTSQDIIVGGSSGTPGRLPVGTEGQVLAISSGVLAWANPSSGFANPMTTAGDIITGGSGGAAQRLALGTTGHALFAGASGPEYRAIGAGDISNAGAANGVATLDASGKLPVAQLPPLAVTEYLGDAANEAAMLALVGQKGDWTVRGDLGTVWIIIGDDPSLLAGWKELGYPTAPVTSVAGKTGAVTLVTADVSGAVADDDARLTDARDWIDYPLTTAEDLLVGGTSGAPNRLPVGTEGQVLSVSSGAVAWANPTSGFSNPMTTAGDLIYGGTGGAAQRLAAGTDGQVLKVVAGNPVWASESGGAGVAANISYDGTTSGLAATQVQAAIDEVVSETGSALAGKQDTLVSGVNIKTFNGGTLLGSGNISVPDGTTSVKGIVQLSTSTSSTSTTLAATPSAVKAAYDLAAAAASATYHGVGSYAFAVRTTNIGSVDPNGTLAGSSLRMSGAWGNKSANGAINLSELVDFSSGTSLPGTWRCMGYARNARINGDGDLFANLRGATLWVRIS